MQVVQIILGLFNAIWQIFADAAIYILFGIFIAGLLQVFVDKDKIARHLGRPGLKSVILSALLGVPLPLLSYGGTALLTIGIACGMLMSISKYRPPET